MICIYRANSYNLRHYFPAAVLLLSLLKVITPRLAQWMHFYSLLFPRVPFSADNPTQVLPFVLHIPGQMQLQLDFSFLNPIPAHLDRFLQGHLPLTPALACFLYSPNFFQELLAKPYHICLISCRSGWATLELRERISQVIPGGLQQLGRASSRVAAASVDSA